MPFCGARRAESGVCHDEEPGLQVRSDPKPAPHFAGRAWDKRENEAGSVEQKGTPQKDEVFLRGEEGQRSEDALFAEQEGLKAEFVPTKNPAYRSARIPSPSRICGAGLE